MFQEREQRLAHRYSACLPGIKKRGRGKGREETRGEGEKFEIEMASFCLGSNLSKFLLDRPAVGASERGSCAAAERCRVSKGSSVLL